MLKDRYVYPAIFNYADDGISVEFPDLPGCFSCGDNDLEAVSMAKDALMLRLYSDESDNSIIPEPTKVPNIKLDNNQAVVLIDVWMPPFRDKMRNRSIKKTLTIPKWLDDMALAENVNYSALLQSAIKQQLNIHEQDNINNSRGNES